MYKKRKKAALIIVRTAAVMLWSVIIIIIVLNRDRITPESIIKMTPKNKVESIFLMFAMFALKSVSVVIYCGILYAANGLLFPLPLALTVNIIGTVIMVTIPYMIGRLAGKNEAQRLTNKYKKLEAIKSLRTNNDLFFAFIVRVVGILPLDIVSLYMGAAEVKTMPYIIGSTAGLTVQIATFTIMGMSAAEPGSTGFLAALSIQLIVSAISFSGFLIYRHKQKNKNEPGGTHENRNN